MSKVFAAVLSVLLVVMVGCQTNGKDAKSAADVCTHCEGVQKANAEGKCPVCNPSGKAADATKASADVCAHCPGDQVATAANKCSKCGADLAKK